MSAADRTQARTLSDLGRHDDARAAIGRALAEDPEDAELWALAATIARRAERTSDATTALARAITLDPDNARNYAEWAIVTTGRWQPETIAAVARNVGYRRQRNKLARGRRSASPDATLDAVEAARRAVQLEPELVYGHYALCIAAYYRFEVDTGREAAAICARLDPDGRLGRLAAAAVAEHDRRWDDAAMIYRRLLADEPDDAWTIERLAHVHAVTGNQRGATEGLLAAGRAAAAPQRSRIRNAFGAYVTAQASRVVWLAFVGLVGLMIAVDVVAPTPWIGAAVMAAATAGAIVVVHRRHRALLRELPTSAAREAEQGIRRFERGMLIVGAVISVTTGLITWGYDPPPPKTERTYTCVPVAPDGDGHQIGPALNPPTTYLAPSAAPSTLAPPRSMPPLSVPGGTFIFPSIPIPTVPFTPVPGADLGPLPSMPPITPPCQWVHLGPGDPADEPQVQRRETLALLSGFIPLIVLALFVGLGRIGRWPTIVPDVGPGD